MGTVLKRANYIELATMCFEHAIVIKPEHAVSYVNLADCFDLTGKVDLATFFYDKALSKQPNNAYFHIALARFKQKHFGLEAAIPLFEKAYLLDANNKNIFLAYCDALYQAGDIQTALSLLENSGIDKLDPNVIRMLQQLLMKQNPELGKQTYFKLIKEHLNQESRYEKLAINLQKIDLAIAENDLLGRVEAHWRKVLD